MIMPQTPAAVLPRIPLPLLRDFRGSVGVASLALILAAGAAGAQAQPPVARPAGDSARPAAPRQARRALDIRATAPAPEVVTIRPREIPAYSRSLLVPVAIAPPPAGSDRGPVTVVIFPGAWPSGPANPAQRPDTPNRPPE